MEFRHVNSAVDIREGDVVAVVYDGEWWLGKVSNTSMEQNDVLVSFLHPHGPCTLFSWPEYK